MESWVGIVIGIIGMVGTGLVTAFSLAWKFRGQFDAAETKQAERHAVISERIAKVETKLDNGVNKTLANYREDLAEIYRVLRDLPCKEHDHRLDAVEAKVKELT